MKKQNPSTCKTQYVVPTHKSDRPPQEAIFYRPISQSSCLGKLFENMLKSRLKWYGESNSIIPHVQNGFRRGHSCADSFTSPIADLKNARDTRSHTVCVILDVEGAFDSVDPSQDSAYCWHTWTNM